MQRPEQSSTSMRWRGARAVEAIGALVVAATLSGDARSFEPFEVGQSVSVGSNCCDPPQQNVTHPLLAEAEQNLSLLDDTAFGGWFSSAHASPGSVGAESFLDYTHGQDYWSGSTTAESADVITVSNPAHPGATVTLLLSAGVSGGLAIEGGLPSASALALFRVDGPVGILMPTNLPGSITSWSPGTILEDHARSNPISEDGTTIYEHTYDYSPRVNHSVEVTLDQTGHAEVWVDLYLSVNVGDDSEDLDFQSIAASDYGDTVTASVMGLGPSGTTLSSATGWDVSPAPEPRGVAGTVAACSALAAVTRLRKRSGPRRREAHGRAPTQR